MASPGPFYPHNSATFSIPNSQHLISRNPTSNIVSSQTPPLPPPKPQFQNNVPANESSKTNTSNFTGSTLNPMTFPASDLSNIPPPIPPLPNQNQQSRLAYSPKPHESNTIPSIPAATSQSPSLAQSSQFQQTNILPPPPLSSPYLPSSLPEKTTTELQPVLSNPALLTAFAQQHPSYQSSVSYLNSAISMNLNVAKQLAYTEAQLRQLRAQTAQLLLNHSSLQTQWRRKQTEMDEALSPWGPRVMYQRLVSSIGEQEAVLKAVQESFLERHGNEAREGHNDGKASEKEINEWVRRIREGTTTLEKRRAMRARWDEGRVGGWR